jgi:hypothetical protein
MDIQKFLAEHDAEYKLEQEKLAAACKEATAVFEKHYPNEQGNLNAPVALAACVELFDLEDPKDAGQLYLEWLVEHYIGRKVAKNIDDIKLVVEALKTAGFTEDNPYDYNDSDNRLFYIPHKEYLIFCAESQNTRYIYILSGNRLHIRRYYDEYDFDGEKDKWEKEEEEFYTKKGIRAAIANSFWLNTQWSDCIATDNHYPHRPSLQHFKDCDFDPRYKDCRDIGYVLTYENLMGSRVDRAIFHYMEIKHAFFQLRVAVGEIPILGA